VISWSRVVFAPIPLICVSWIPSKLAQFTQLFARRYYGLDFASVNNAGLDQCVDLGDYCMALAGYHWLGRIQLALPPTDVVQTSGSSSLGILAHRTALD
jgi:hypothetical protein